jgi:hypothetical protein
MDAADERDPFEEERLHVAARDGDRRKCGACWREAGMSAASMTRAEDRERGDGRASTSCCIAPAGNEHLGRPRTLSTVRRISMK